MQRSKTHCLLQQVVEFNQQLASANRARLLDEDSTLIRAPIPAHLFVTALGASGFGFGAAFWSEDTEAWCQGHIQASEYFGGAPQLLVPDIRKQL